MWVYGEWQNAYEKLGRDMPHIEFVKNFNAKLYESFDPRVRNLLILDDQMENAEAHKRSSDSVVKFFTQGSHHRNLTVAYIVQNLFNQDRSMRTVSLNTHYIVAFKSKRDGTQIITLANQMFPNHTNHPHPVLEAFKDATAVTPERGEHGYLVLDFHPTSCDAFCLLTDVFDEHPTVYVPNEYIRAATMGRDHDSASVSSDGSSTVLPNNKQLSAAQRKPRRAKPRTRRIVSQQAAEETSRKRHRSEADRQVPQRLFDSPRILQRTKGRAGRSDQSNLQRGAQRGAGRRSFNARPAAAVRYSSRKDIEANIIRPQPRHEAPNY